MRSFVGRGNGTFKTATIHRVTSFNDKPEEEYL